LLDLQQPGDPDSLPWLVSFMDLDALKAEDARRAKDGETRYTSQEYEAERDALVHAVNNGIGKAFDALPDFEGKAAWNAVKDTHFSPDKLRLFLQRRVARGVVAVIDKVDKDFHGNLSAVEQKVLEAKAIVEESSHETVESVVHAAYTQFSQTFKNVRL
jgi:hypothetical protein